MFQGTAISVLAIAVICGGICFPGFAAQESNLPPSADTAKQALESSPRHGEYANIPLPGSETKMKTWVVYPERAEKAPVVLVIHEIFGLSEWVQAIADALAKEGFIAVAPDLIAGIVGAEANPREAIRKLTEEETIKRLNAALDYGLALPASNGKCASIGFCWGGATSFLYATVQPKLNAAVVYYGTSPDTAALSKISAPVLGLYGQMDERVNSTIPAAEAEMKRLGKSYEKAVYDNAGHGFLRQQDGREDANRKASEQAWPLTIEFLKKLTKP
ncbi:MAG: dienelactone hydrolase family protein [Candidatus Hydrogenedentes bacterium]|nr:dienelactone hydrolase family protein [Candidatus Hydrogenedentota bacterium]